MTGFYHDEFGRKHPEPIISAEMQAWADGMDIQKLVGYIHAPNSREITLALQKRLSLILKDSTSQSLHLWAIKPLEWEKHTDIDEWYSCDAGDHGVGDYDVFSDPETPEVWRLRVRGYVLSDDFSTPDEAKAEAASDYENRIRHAVQRPSKDAVRDFETLLNDHRDQAVSSIFQELVERFSNSIRKSTIAPLEGLNPPRSNVGANTALESDRSKGVEL